MADGRVKMKPNGGSVQSLMPPTAKMSGATPTARTRKCFLHLDLGTSEPTEPPTLNVVGVARVTLTRHVNVHGHTSNDMANVYTRIALAWRQDRHVPLFLRHDINLVHSLPGLDFPKHTASLYTGDNLTPTVSQFQSHTTFRIDSVTAEPFLAGCAPPSAQSEHRPSHKRRITVPYVLLDDRGIFLKHQ